MRTIVQNGDPVLRLVATGVGLVDIKGGKLAPLIADMQRLLAKEEYGVALAAPQVGESVRLFVVSGRAIERRKAKYDDDTADQAPVAADEVYINPVMTKVSRAKKDKHEGCLSVRGYWGEVPRSEKVTLEYLDEKGVKRTRGASGFLAHIFQHEMDHLDGVLYIDKATHIEEETEHVDTAA